MVSELLRPLHRHMGSPRPRVRRRVSKVTCAQPGLDSAPILRPGFFSSCCGDQSALQPEPVTFSVIRVFRAPWSLKVRGVRFCVQSLPGIAVGQLPPRTPRPTREASAVPSALWEPRKRLRDREGACEAVLRGVGGLGMGSWAWKRVCLGF